MDFWGKGKGAICLNLFLINFLILSGNIHNQGSMQIYSQTNFYISVVWIYITKIMLHLSVSLAQPSLQS